MSSSGIRMDWRVAVGVPRSSEGASPTTAMSVWGMPRSRSCWTARWARLGVWKRQMAVVAGNVAGLGMVDSACVRRLYLPLTPILEGERARRAERLLAGAECGREPIF